MVYALELHDDLVIHRGVAARDCRDTRDGGLARDAHVRAVVSRAHFDKVMAHIALACQEGGKILCGGESVRLPKRSLEAAGSFTSSYCNTPIAA